MKKTSKKYFGFTLVELIIVITILAILATIAFVSFQNYTSQTRDTKRVSDLTQISKGLDIFQVTSGTLPTPDSPKTLTGGNSTLLVGKINSKVLSNLGGEVFDPSTKTEYTYATIGNGKYYQIGADSENLVTSVFQNTFADAKSSIVKGNYLFDPSLPSLIISSGSSLYDPNNCFVINGGTNLVSNNTNCTSKANTSLKNFDSSLVGYWDMETTNLGKLKDLSGNGYDGTLNGSMVIGNTGTSIGKGSYFDGVDDYIGVPSISGKKFSVSYLMKMNSAPTTSGLYGLANYVINSRTWAEGSIYSGYQESAVLGQCLTVDVNGVTPMQNNELSFFKNYKLNDLLNNYFLINFSVDSDKKTTKLYINGKLVKENNYQTYPTNLNLDLNIGGNFYIRGGRYFNGTIDDLKIYNRILTDEEILRQANLAGF